MNENTDKKGFVYILVNPAFTGFVKVGKTIKEPEIRARGEMRGQPLKVEF